MTTTSQRRAIAARKLLDICHDGRETDWTNQSTTTAGRAVLEVADQAHFYTVPLGYVTGVLTGAGCHEFDTEKHPTARRIADAILAHPQFADVVREAVSTAYRDHLRGDGLREDGPNGSELDLTGVDAESGEDA